MIPITLDKIKKYLVSKKFDVQLQEETQQLYIIFKIEEREFPLFIRVFEDSELVQLLTFIPITVKKESYEDLARLLHLLNKEMDMPGFGMDEQAGVVFYRCMIPALDKQIDETILDAYLHSTQVVCKSFTPVIVAVVVGAASFEDVLEKAAQNRAQQSGQEPPAFDQENPREE